MVEINIERQHGIGLEEARRRIAQVEDKLRDRYGVQIEWRGDEATFEGSGLSGVLCVEEQRVAVRLRLGLLLRPLSTKIQEAMEAQLDKALS